uniref:7TM GPCR serpentine receptor class x (Srx) domain-containing protein n=1 Tax=Romanomermis culicivorax TaxID=13658 RepID=A0A915L2N6_ROMCU
MFNLTYNGLVTTNELTIFYIRLFSDRFGDGFGYFPTLFINVLIAMNRFTAIVLYSKHNKIFTAKTTKIFIVLSLLIGNVVTSTYFIYPAKYYENQDEDSNIWEKQTRKRNKKQSYDFHAVQN